MLGSLYYNNPQIMASYFLYFVAILVFLVISMSQSVFE